MSESLASFADAFQTRIEKAFSYRERKCDPKVRAKGIMIILFYTFYLCIICTLVSL